jgi:enoyl-CoA hydratase/carnithine racemase
MPYDTLLVEVQEPCGLITINRPDKLNALNRTVLDELERALRQLEADPAARVIVLTGAGEKAFAAGADIRELAGLSPAEAIRHARAGQRLMGLVSDSPRPVVAAINGFALGGGLELALACDIRIASDKAQLGLPEVSLGLIPGYGGTQRLPRVVPRGKALELILTGDRIGAAEALSIGLVDRVVPAAELAAQARALAAAIARRGPAAVSLAKRAVHVGVDSGLEAGLAYEAAQFGVVSGTADAREGCAAFLEKREPRFTGA